MPSLLKVAFDATTTQATIPVAGDEGTYTIYAPESPESCVEATTTTVDLHMTINIPNGWYAKFTPLVTDLTGAADCFARDKIFYGTGAAQAFTLEVVNNASVHGTPGTDNKTITNSTAMGYLDFFPRQDRVATFTGTWA